MLDSVENVKQKLLPVEQKKLFGTKKVKVQTKISRKLMKKVQYFPHTFVGFHTSLDFFMWFSTIFVCFST